MDNIDITTQGYERRYKDSAYYRLPRDIIKKYRDSEIFGTLLTISAGYRTGPNKLYGFNVRKQASEEYLIKLCIGGQGWLEIDGYRTPIHSGDLFLINKNTKHAYGTSTKNPWSVYWAYFNCSYLDELIPELSDKQCMILPITDDLAVTNHLKTIISHMKKGYAKPYQYAASARLSVLLSFVQILLGNRTQTDKHSLEAIIDYMSANMDKNLDINTLADMTGLSKDHFIRLFSEKNGFTPIDYFIRLKIQRACELLLSTDTPIKTIALMLGYNDYYYFSRVFKQKIGVSPKNYRSANSI